MNMVGLTGRLVRDADLRHLGKDAIPNLFFTLAVDRNKDEADFPSCRIVGKLASSVADHMRKGKHIEVTGKLRTSIYKKDGKDVYSTEVLIDSMKFLGKKED